MPRWRGATGRQLSWAERFILELLASQWFCGGSPRSVRWPRRRPRRLSKKEKNNSCEKNVCHCADLGVCLWATDVGLTHRETAFPETGMGRGTVLTGRTDNYMLHQWSEGCWEHLELSFWSEDGKITLDLQLPESLL